jgi:hypothetical protein
MLIRFSTPSISKIDLSLKTTVSILASFFICTQMPVPGICNPTDALTEQSINAEHGCRLGSIRIEGNHRIGEEQIRERMKTKIGDKYDREAIVRDLRSIYCMGCFDGRGFRVNPEFCGKDEISLTIHVKEISETNDPEQGTVYYQQLRFDNFSNMLTQLLHKERSRFNTRITYRRLASASLGSPTTLFFNGQPVRPQFRCNRTDVDAFIQNQSDALNGYDAL